jgi:hypothetical protein
MLCTVRPLSDEPDSNIMEEWSEQAKPRRVTTHMTELLRKAFEQAAKLPPSEQDAFAALVLAELEADARWDGAFGESLEELGALADEARSEFSAGRTEPLDPDKL